MALLACVHSNAEAFDAVLEDIERHGATPFVLGDLLGYGPQPIETLRRAIALDGAVILRGDHEAALLSHDGEADWDSTMARRVLQWTRDRLARHTPDQERERFRDFLQLLPSAHTPENYPDLRLVHGSPADPTRGAVLPELTRAGSEDACAALMDTVDESLVFCAHTHVPGILTERPAWILPEVDEPLVLAPPATAAELAEEECPEHGRILHSRRYLINVGSVGQPRDRDPRASYVLFDPETRTARFRRVSYDLDVAEQKLKELCRAVRVDANFSTRLRHGV